MRNIRLGILRRVTAFLLACFIVGSGLWVSGCSSKNTADAGEALSASWQADMVTLSYDGKPYVVINDNNPDFTEADMTTASFESYGELDGLEDVPQHLRILVKILCLRKSVALLVR